MTAGELSAVPSEARAYQGIAAGLVTRLLAAAIDGLIATATVVVTFLGINAIRFVVHPAQYEPIDSSWARGIVAGLVVLLVYLTVAWSITGRTYGDHVMGLRVVSRTGGKVGAVAAALRAALCIAFPIGLLWCAGGPSRQSLQDKLLRTAVVYDWRSHRTSRSRLLPIWLSR